MLETGTDASIIAVQTIAVIATLVRYELFTAPYSLMPCHHNCVLADFGNSTEVGEKAVIDVFSLTHIPERVR